MFTKFFTACASIFLTACVAPLASESEPEPISESADPNNVGTPDQTPPAPPTPGPCFNKPEGLLCGGDFNDPVHGECDNIGSCFWTEYTCKYKPTGTACTAGSCSLGECCKLCVAKDGTCKFVISPVTGKPVYDGLPCP